MSTLAVVGPPAVAAPCPPWCEEGEGHEYETMDVDERGDVGRWHSAVVARGTFDDRVTIDAEAVADRDAAMTERVAGPLISIILQGGPGDPKAWLDGITADRARELAHFLHGALLAAANRLDRITEA